MAKKREERTQQKVSTAVRRVSLPAGQPSGQARRSRRRPIAGLLVQIEAPAVGREPWVVDAVDLSADGMGVVLPDDLATGTEVLLTFRLDADTVLVQVPARVLHREPQAGGGGVEFATWSDADRLRLLEHLVRFYESES